MSWKKRTVSRYLIRARTTRFGITGSGYGVLFFFFNGTISFRFKCWSSDQERDTALSRVSPALPCYGRKPQTDHPIRDVERNYDRRRGCVQLIRDKFHGDFHLFGFESAKRWTRTRNYKLKSISRCVECMR